MNIFEYLSDDEAYLERHLKQLVTHYFQWSPEHVFEESAKLFASITTHLDKKETLLTNYLSSIDDDMKAILKESTRQSYEIGAEINSLTQMHIDEVGYAKSMEALLRRMINHRKYCQKWFYPQVEQHLSKTDRAIIDSKLEDLVFS